MYEFTEEEKQNYKPVVPKWVSEMVFLEKRNQLPMFGKELNKFSSWKQRYSRKYKYAKLNGWTFEG